jgi:Fe-S-cluster containining protein
VDRQSPFSYVCNACGRCCHDKVIALSPYDVLRLARAAGITTAETIKRFTIRRGSILKFNDDSRCSALDGVRCGVHAGRPLACRLYPLGLERDGDADRFITLEPAAGSLGVYGEEGIVDDFLAAQDVGACLNAVARYATLIPIVREQIALLVDFERIEPCEFWRRARREAMAESNYDENPLIDALFDADRFVSGLSDPAIVVESHLNALAALIIESTDVAALAAAAVLLAVSLGYSPAEAETPSAITSGRRKTSARAG